MFGVGGTESTEPFTLEFIAHDHDDICEGIAMGDLPVRGGTLWAEERQWLLGDIQSWL